MYEQVGYKNHACVYHSSAIEGDGHEINQTAAGSEVLPQKHTVRCDRSGVAGGESQTINCNHYVHTINTHSTSVSKYPFLRFSRSSRETCPKSNVAVFDENLGNSWQGSPTRSTLCGSPAATRAASTRPAGVAQASST